MKTFPKRSFWWIWDFKSSLLKKDISLIVPFSIFNKNQLFCIILETIDYCIYLPKKLRFTGSGSILLQIRLVLISHHLIPSKLKNLLITNILVLWKWLIEILLYFTKSFLITIKELKVKSLTASPSQGM